MHPASALQTRLVAALSADAGLIALLGSATAIFDAPPKGFRGPFIAISRHDVTPRDGDLAPGLEHRLQLLASADAPSRKAVLALAERVLEVALAVSFPGPDLRVTHRRHERTDTMIDPETGQARAAIALRFYSEPAS